MQKGFTGKRPTSHIIAAAQGLVSFMIYNNSAVNLYIGEDDTSAVANNGVPILPNASLSGLWEGDMWIGADLDNTEFRYFVSKSLSFDNSQQNSNQGVCRTVQGFLSPRLSSFILFLLMFFSLFAKPLRAQQYNKVPVIGNKVTILDGTVVTSASVTNANSFYVIGPVPPNSQFVLDIDNARTLGVTHATGATGGFFMYCSIDPGLTTFNLSQSASILIPYNYQISSIGSVPLASPIQSGGNTPVISVPTGTHAIITTGIVPCSYIILTFGTFSNPNSDLIGVYGQFIQNPIPHNLSLSNFDSALNAYSHQTDATVHVIKGTAGVVHTVNVNLGAVGTLTLFDLNAGNCTGTPVTAQVHIWTLTAVAQPTFTLDENFTQGICIKASVAMDYTVSYQ